MSTINNNLHVNINFAGGFEDRDTNLIRFGKRGKINNEKMDN